MNEEAPALRPMSVSDILDTTFNLYRQNFALFAGIVAVLGVPQAVINTALAVGRPASPMVTHSNGTSHFNVGDLGAFGILTGGSSVVSLIFYVLITGALARAISARYLGRSMTVGHAYSDVGIRTFITLALGSLVYGLIAVLGFIALIIPGVYWIFRGLFMPQAIVLEDKRIWSGLRRSAQLVKGTWWRVFGIALLVYLIVGILSGIVGGVSTVLTAFVDGTTGKILSQGLSSIVTIFIQPIQLIAITLLYYDLRIRKEGFDLEQMADRIGGVASGTTLSK